MIAAEPLRFLDKPPLDPERLGMCPVSPAVNTPLHLAFISWELPPENNGGIGAYTWHIARAFAARGHEVTVFCGRADSSGETDREGVHLVWLRCPDRQLFPSLVGPVFDRLQAARPFDLVEGPDLCAEAAAIAQNHPRLPLVIRAHTPASLAHRVDMQAYPVAAKIAQLTRLGAGRLTGRTPAGAFRSCRATLFPRRFATRDDPEKALAARARKILVPSQGLNRWLQTFWQLPAGHFAVLPYVHLPNPALLALPPPTGPVRSIFFHGRICHFKGMLTLAKALKKVLARHPGITVTLAGSIYHSPHADWSWGAWKRGAVCSYADTRELMVAILGRHATRCVFTGYLRPDELPAHLARADLCVQPSLFDNFPNACLEAMTAARPIIATRSGGMEDMLAPTGAGLLVAPGDHRALASGLLRVIADDGLRTTLALRARERVLAAYGAKSILDTHETVFRHAMTATAAHSA